MLEKHHIIFKSQGGLDYELNYKRLTPEQHRGDLGPHKCRETDLRYKKELQRKLENILTDEFYTIEELIKTLGLKERQAYKAFKKVNQHEKGMKREDVIFRLMGNRFYL
jgi:hypothetical protein